MKPKGQRSRGAQSCRARFSGGHFPSTANLAAARVFFIQKEERRSSYELFRQIFEEKDVRIPIAAGHTVFWERLMTNLNPGCFGILAVVLDKLRTRLEPDKTRIGGAGER